MEGGTFDVLLLTIEEGIFEEKATADNGEHEITICGKFNKFNLESCIKELCEECTQWCWLFFLKNSKRIRSNTAMTAYMGSSFLDACPACPRTQTTFPIKWQIRTAQQPRGKFVGIEYNTEFEQQNDDMLEENYMTVYVKMIYEKTISIKCDRNLTAVVISDEVERRSSIPRDMIRMVHKGKMLSEKKTMKDNNIEVQATIEMSLRLLGGMEMNEQMDTHETEEDREKKRKLEEGKEEKATKPNDDMVYLKRDIMEAVKRSDEKMESCSRNVDEEMESYSRKADGKMERYSRRPMKEWMTSQGKLMRCWKSFCRLLTQLGDRSKG